MILPVGHYNGNRTIRVGRTRVSFTDPEPYRAWAAAHRPPGDLTKPWGRAEIAAASSEAAVDHLLADGLLIELSEATARTHKAVPILIALGNTDEERNRFGIGLFGLEPIITVPPLVYELWQWGAVSVSIWAVCEAFAVATARATGTATTTEDVFTEYRAALPGLVGSNASYIDQT